MEDKSTEISTFQNLYNKHRPSSFTEVVGQEHITKLLEKQISNGTLPHFIIFYGPPGVGKTTCARIVASMLNKSSYGLIEIDSATDGGKDNVRNLQSDVFNRPLEGNYKTYIYDEAHEITRQAFSSLLKITEEPPQHVKFIFITNNFESIPLNIRSRAQCHQFIKINSNLIKKRIQDVLKLEKQNIPDDLVDLIVEAGNGSLRNSLVSLESVITSYLTGQTNCEIADILGIVGSKRLSSWVLSFLNGDLKAVCTGVSIFSSDRTDTIKAISELQQFTTDARLCLAMPDLINTVRSDVRGFLSSIDTYLNSLDPQVRTTSKVVIGRLLDELYDISLTVEIDAKRTNNKEALLNRFAIKLGRVWNDKESILNQKSR